MNLEDVPDMERGFDDLRKAFANSTSDPSVLMERLPVDLRKYLTHAPELGWTCFKHPLCFMVPFFGSDHEMHHIKEGIPRKQEQIDKAASRGELSRVVTFYERAYRFQALVSHRSFARFAKDPDKAFYDAMGYAWVDSENVWENLSAWRKLWREAATNEGVKHAMTVADRKFLRETVEGAKRGKVTIFRGATLGLNERGLSWTTNKPKAKWFATRFRAFGSSVLSTEVPVEKIVAAFVGRGESEVVIHPDFISRAKLTKL